MPRFRIDDLPTIENTPTSPKTLRAKVGQVIDSSMVCRAKVNSLNTDTGEYQIVLQGTLDKEDTKWEEF